MTDPARSSPAPSEGPPPTRWQRDDESGSVRRDLGERQVRDAGPRQDPRCECGELPGGQRGVGDDAEHWAVVGEAPALERAVTNLLDNAAKWGPPGSTITVRLRDGVLTVDDDPGSDLKAAHGRFLYFAPDEVEPLGVGG